MEYTDLFKETNTRQNKDFRCVVHPKAGKFSFPQTASCLMVFILQGDIEVTPSMHTIQKVSAGNLIVIKLQTLLHAQCSDNTILLEYAPPKRLCNYFDQCSAAFQMPCSTIVPILAPLQAWIDTLLFTYMLSGELSPECDHEQRKSLAKTLMQYPKNQLSELFAPFMFCAQGSCKECLELESQNAVPETVH